MLSLAFAALGFLIGNLTGLSASPLATVLLSAVFALFGGSILALLSKTSTADRHVAGSCLLAFSVACLIGVYAGINITSHKVFGSFQSAGSPFYLRAADVDAISAIDQQVRGKTLDKGEAYDRLLRLTGERP